MENQNKAGITAADVIRSDNFKQLTESHLAPIRKKIEEAQKTLKAGERLYRTPAIRLNELGLLKTEAFTDAYACIVAKTPIPLSATLRNAIKEDGDYIFVQAYAQLTHKPENDEAKV